MLFLKHKKNKLGCCALFVLFLCFNGISQRSPYGLPFVDYSKNKIYYGKDSSAMMAFFKKIDELRQGKRTRVTIAHYGGSHIQGGFWSDKLAENFQAIGKFEGGGFFAFPFKLAKTNSPHYFKTFTIGNWKRCRSATSKELCANFGMSGITVTSNDSVNSFGVKINANPHHKTFNIIKVYHNFNPSFEFYLPEGTMQFARKDVKEQGFTAFAFETFIDSVNFLVKRVDTVNKDFMLYGFSLENTNPGFYYAGMGVNGATSSSYLRCEFLKEQLKSLQPDLYIFSMGVNDTQDRDFSKSEYIMHYDSLISLIKQVSPNTAILFTTTTDNYIKRRTANKRPIKAGEAMFELMEKHNAAVWDAYGVMGGYKSMYKWYKAGLAAKDKVHFNGRGYYIMGQLMFDAIDRSYRYNSKIK